MTEPQKAEPQEVVVVLTRNLEDIYYYVYTSEAVDGVEMLDEEGCMTADLGAVTPLAEPSTLLELMTTIRENGWLVVDAAEAITY